MTRQAFALWIALALALVGCEGEASETSSGSATPPALEEAPAPTEESGAVEAPEATQATAEARETRHAPVAPEAAGDLRETGEALAAAIRAAASVDGDTDCDRAYNGAIAMVEALRLETGQEGEGEVPSRADFVAHCLQLPPEAQRCLVMSHALEHREECARWRDDPRVQAMRDDVSFPAP